MIVKNIHPIKLNRLLNTANEVLIRKLPAFAGQPEYEFVQIGDVLYNQTIFLTDAGRDVPDPRIKVF